MTAPTPTFGPRIRAARLGWGYCARHGCFVRMSDADGLNTRGELCPVRGVPSKKVAGGLHRMWWEGGPDVLDLIPWLCGVRVVKRYICVVIDENGNIVRSETAHAK